MDFKKGFLVTILAGATAIALMSQALAGTVSGSVTYRERIAVLPGAKLLVELRDVSLADAPSELIASKEYDLTAVPADYELSFKDAEIDEKHRYAVSARITVDGELLFISDTSYPVLTHGAADTADVIVKKVSASAPAGADLQLDGTKWALVELAGQEVTKGRDPGFAFGADGQFSGSSGCNRFSGQAEVDGNKISFPDKVAGTLMACTPELSTQEEAFLLAMSNVKLAERQGPVLKLLAEDGTTLMALTLVQ